MFVDEIKIYARAGHGGKGCVAFHREAFVAKGGPSGGNGGRGGDVILRADHDLNNLIAQYYSPRLTAEDGEAGMGKGMDGHAGKDLIVKVPCGTLVWSSQSNSLSSTKTLETEREQAEQETLLLGTNQRPLIRHSGSERAMEIDLSEDESAAPPPLHRLEKGKLI